MLDLLLRVLAVAGVGVVLVLVAVLLADWKEDE